MDHMPDHCVAVADQVWYCFLY